MGERRYKIVGLKLDDNRSINVELRYRFKGGTKDVPYLSNGDPGYPGEAPEFILEGFTVTRYHSRKTIYDSWYLQSRGWMEIVKQYATKLIDRAVDRDSRFMELLLEEERDHEYEVY